MRRFFVCVSACRGHRRFAGGFNFRKAKFSGHGGSRVSCRTIQMFFFFSHDHPEFMRIFACPAVMVVKHVH